jgi:ABC-type nitrate/sulfonate/bicarbonate transport system permease component
VTVAARRVRAPANGWFRLPALPAGTAALLVGALAWEGVAWLWQVPFFPPLSAVLARLVAMIGEGMILGNLAQSLSDLTVGFAISVVFGIAIGVLMGAYSKVEAALGIYVNAFLTAPSLVFAPVFFSMFGLGRATIVAVIVMYSIFIIIVQTTAAMKVAPQDLLEMGRSYCAPRGALLRRIILPAATPLIMAGVRLGMGRAVKGMINGEMFIAVVGLGRIVMDAGRRFDAESVLAVLIVIVIVAMGAVKIVQIIDGRLTGWLPSTARGA